jgi:glycosyltransferase involved in cell wall biosynthesis
LGFGGTKLNKKVIVRAPVLTRTGYGEHARFVLRCLREIEDKIDIYILPVSWGQSNWIWENDEERRWLDDIIKKTAIYQQQKGQFDISVQVTIPNEWQKMAPVNIGVTAGIETTKVAPVWIQKLNEMDKVVTISEHSKQAFLRTVYEGVDSRTNEPATLQCNKEPVIVRYPVKEFEEVDLNLDLSTKFNFLTVAQFGPRKNLGNTIRWFIEEFFDNPDVGLIVKTFQKGGSKIDRKRVRTQLDSILKSYDNRQCKVYFLHGDFTDQEMHSLYKAKSIKALISLSHGEGFGLPLFEAAYSGLPVIAADWSGHVDFLYKPTKDKKKRIKMKPHFAKVEYDLQQVQKEAHWEGVVQPDSMWCFPQQGSYKMKLREVLKEHGRFKKQAKQLKEYILKEFTFENQSKKFIEAVIPLEEYNMEQWLDDFDVEEYA